MFLIYSFGKMRLLLNHGLIRFFGQPEIASPRFIGEPVYRLTVLTTQMSELFLGFHLLFKVTLCPPTSHARLDEIPTLSLPHPSS